MALSDGPCTTDHLDKNANVEFSNLGQRNGGSAIIEYRADAVAEFCSNEKEQIKGKIMINLTNSTYEKYRSARIDVAAVNNPVLYLIQFREMWV